MKNTITTIIGMVLLTSLVTAMYAGDCIEVDLSNMTSFDNVVYTVVGNESDLEGLTIDLNGTIANVCTVINYKPDNFTLIFIDNSTKEIIKEVPVYHGGGTKRIYVENKTIEYIETIKITECDDGITCTDDDDIEKTESFFDSIYFKTIVVVLLLTLIFILGREILRGKKK